MDATTTRLVAEYNELHRARAAEAARQREEAAAAGKAAEEEKARQQAEEKARQAEGRRKQQEVIAARQKRHDDAQALRDKFKAECDALGTQGENDANALLRVATYDEPFEALLGACAGACGTVSPMHAGLIRTRAAEAGLQDHFKPPSGEHLRKQAAYIRAWTQTLHRVHEDIRKAAAH